MSVSLCEVKMPRLGCSILGCTPHRLLLEGFLACGGSKLAQNCAVESLLSPDRQRSEFHAEVRSKRVLIPGALTTPIYSALKLLLTNHSRRDCCALTSEAAHMDSKIYREPRSSSRQPKRDNEPTRGTGRLRHLGRARIVGRRIRAVGEGCVVTRGLQRSGLY